MVDEKRDYISEAKLWLGYARERVATDDVEHEINWMREYAGRAKVALKEIGTSEEEITELLRNGYIAGAKKWLKHSRERAGNEEIEQETEWTKKYLAKAGITPEDIETSAKELDELLKKGWISEAKKWVSHARERAATQEVESEVKYAIKYAEKAKMTLEEIGTSAKELHELLEQGDASEAKK